MEAFTKQFEETAPLDAARLNILTRTHDFFGSEYVVGTRPMFALLHLNEEELEIVSVIPESFDLLDEQFVYVGPATEDSVLPRFVKKGLEHLYGITEE